MRCSPAEWTLIQTALPAHEDGDALRDKVEMEIGRSGARDVVDIDLDEIESLLVNRALRRFNFS